MTPDASDSAPLLCQLLCQALDEDYPLDPHLDLEGGVLIPILQMRKPRLRKEEGLAQGHPAESSGAGQEPRGVFEEGRVECGGDEGVQRKVSLGESEIVCFSTAPLYTTSRNIQLPPAILTPEFSLTLVSPFSQFKEIRRRSWEKQPGAVKAETAAELH